MSGFRVMRRASWPMAAVAALAAVWAFTAAVAAQAPGSQRSTSNTPLMSDQAFKNVTALKGIPVDDFMGTMGIMSAALGFDCSECHVAAGTEKVDWAFDTPRKITSRKMVNMVTAINRDNFGGRQVVTCWTCHRGRDRPVVTPKIDYVYGEPIIETDDMLFAAQGVPTADAIIDKYLNAIGGAQRWSTLTSFAAKGTSVGFGGFGGGGQVEVYAKTPDQHATIIAFKDAPGRDNSTRTFDGKAGWIKTPLTVLGEYALSGSDLDGAKVDAMLSFPNQIKQALTNLRVSDPQTLEGREVNVVQGTGPRNMLVTMYFDKESGLLTRTVRYGRSPIGRLPTQIDYSDYRDAGNGVKMPFKYTFAWLDGRDAFQLTSVQFNVPIDAAKFGRPPANQ